MLSLILGCGLKFPLHPYRYRLGVGHELLSNNFYDYADELPPEEEDEEQLAEWIREHPSRGVVRYTDVVPIAVHNGAMGVMMMC